MLLNIFHGISLSLYICVYYSPAKATNTINTKLTMCFQINTASIKYTWQNVFRVWRCSVKRTLYSKVYYNIIWIIVDASLERFQVILCMERNVVTVTHFNAATIRASKCRGKYDGGGGLTWLRGSRGRWMYDVPG